ncbi:hypothetical protein BC835DRAFT_1071915 [Cytidiella melzeri]|nr:hypothetical protein BC835DRAFT_1071915 [Cytidiella melzeri]
MATAADIPPELFKHILYHVGSGSQVLRQFGSQERRDTITHLASCSLTCVYWAHASRPKLFEAIRLQCLEDLQGLSSLVLDTPKGFTPVSEYIHYAELVQRADERFWLHALPLHPSNGLGVLTSRDTPVFVDISIVGPASADSRHFTRRLSTGLPRNLPSHIVHCDSLTLKNCHLQTLGGFERSLLAFAASRMFSSLWVHLVNCTWDGFRVANALLSGSPFKLPPYFVHVTARDCSNNVESAWAAFAFGEQICCRWSDHSLPLLLHPSDLRVIHQVSRILHQSIESVVSAQLVDRPAFFISNGFISRIEPRSPAICGLYIYQEPILDVTLSPEDRVGLKCNFYARVGHDEATLAQVALVEIFPLFQSAHGATISAEYAKRYPWDQMVDLLGSLQGLGRLCFIFNVRDDLVQFMEAARPALARLHDRVELWYQLGLRKAHRVDFVTLEETGQIV